MCLALRLAAVAVLVSAQDSQPSYAASYAASASPSPLAAVLVLCGSSSCGTCPPSATLPLGVCVSLPDYGSIMLVASAGGYTATQCAVLPGSSRPSLPAGGLFLPLRSCTPFDGMLCVAPGQRQLPPMPLAHSHRAPPPPTLHPPA